MAENNFNLEEYLAEGAEIIVKDAIKATFRNPKESLFLAKEYYSFPIYSLLEICAKYDDIPESALENFFEEAEEHANFLLDCVKVK